MPPDSLTQTIIDSVLKSMKTDTLHLKIILPQTTSPSSISMWVPVAAAVGAAIITALVTTILKLRELKKIQADLDLKSGQLKLAQDQFQFSKNTTDQQLANELKTVEDLKRNFDLSIKKFNYNRYEKLLQMADKVLSANEKERVAIIRSLNKIVEDIGENIPPPDDYDYYEMMDLSAPMIYGKFKEIKAVIEPIIRENPHIQPSITKKLREIKSNIESIEYSEHREDDGTEQGYDVFYSTETRRIFGVYQELAECVGMALTEFEILEKVKDQLIKEQFNEKEQAQ